MSLFDTAMQPAPSAWALDELEVPDVFTPMHLDNSASEAPAEVESPEDAAINALVAQRVQEQLQSTRARLEAEAYSRGYTAGTADTQDQANAQVARVLEALVEATETVVAHEQKWLANVEENLAAMAVTVARHLMQRELEADPSLVTELISRALLQFPNERRITVRLHPDDLAVLQDAVGSGVVDGTADREIRWQSDPHIVRGGCLVEGRERVLDGRIDTALERAYRTLSQVQA